VVEGIVYRYRTGIPWRDLFGPWQTVWKRHRGYAGDGTWDRVLGRLLAEADAAEKVDWRVSVDATITRKRRGRKAGDLRGWTSKPTRDATL
jgi:transposase